MQHNKKLQLGRTIDFFGVQVFFVIVQTHPKTSILIIPWNKSFFYRAAFLGDVEEVDQCTCEYEAPRNKRIRIKLE